MSPFPKQASSSGMATIAICFPKLSASSRKSYREPSCLKTCAVFRRSILQLPQSAAGEPERARVFVRLATVERKRLRHASV